MNGNIYYLEPAEIISTVARNLNVSPEQVISTRRKREYIKAKHIAMYFCRQFTDYSTEKIGEFFNGKDHSTIIHATKSVNNQKDIYKLYRKQLELILEELEIQAGDEVDSQKYKNYDTDNV